MCVRSGRGTPTSTESKSGLNPHTTPPPPPSSCLTSFRLLHHILSIPVFIFIRSFSLFVRLVRVAFWVGPFNRHVRPSAKKIHLFIGGHRAGWQTWNKMENRRLRPAKKGREEAVVAAFLVCQSVQACTSRQSRSRHHQTTNPVRSGPFRSTVFKLSTNRLSPVDQVKPNPALRPSAPNGPLLLSSSRLVIFRFFLILPIRVFIFFASLQQIIHFTFERLDQ